MKMVKIRGQGPEGFFEWFDGLDGRDAQEKRMLQQCRFEQA